MNAEKSLSAEVTARKDWICPETYALTLQAVKSEAVRADAAEAECARLREDAARWQEVLRCICHSFDGQNRTYYLRVTGRIEFADFIDAALRGKETP